MAIQGKQKEICHLLLDHKANVNEKDSKGATPLHMAYYKHNPYIPYGDDYIIRLLLNYGADPKSEDNRGYIPEQWIPRPDCIMNLTGVSGPFSNPIQDSDFSNSDWNE